MKKLNLPTLVDCSELIKQYHVPSHILKHCLAVSKLGVFLAQKLKEKGIQVNAEQVDRACLLHDIVKICDIKEPDYSSFAEKVSEEDKAKWKQINRRYHNLGHENAAYEILKKRYPTLALTIKKHRYMAMLNCDERPNSWEERLVYYADMRVMHDKIVPLEVRLEDGHKRNARRYETNSKDKFNRDKADSLIYRLEKEIFEKITLEPTEVTDELIDSYNHDKGVGKNENSD
jgi:putative nucleotidyltransferase with HDIG domain